MRHFFRKAYLGASAILFKRGGYFIPYRYAGTSSPPPLYPAILDLFDAAKAEMRQRLLRMEEWSEDLRAIPAEGGAPHPRWNQDWFPGLDAALLYATMRELRPRLWIEIGSGHSTRFAARAIEDGQLTTRLIAIDPAPRAVLSGLAVEWRKGIAQDQDIHFYRSLGAGDVLFVDSSHVLMPGTDVDYLLSHVLPLLPSGIYLHIHDIFLPYQYPKAWDWRGYNEQNAILPLLLSDNWDVIAASHYMARHLAEEIGQGIMGRIPHSSAPVSSLWLRKR